LGVKIIILRFATFIMMVFLEMISVLCALLKKNLILVSVGFHLNPLPEKVNFTVNI